jgi:hypothetical protein
MKSRILAVVFVLTAVSLPLQSQSGHVGSFDIIPPIYQIFTVTDWVDVTNLALKTTIPGGISGTLYTNFKGKIALKGKIFKQGKSDSSPIMLGDFFTEPFAIDDSVGVGQFKYTLTMGDLASGGSKIDVTFNESSDYKKFKDEISGGASANISGAFRVELEMYDGVLRLADWGYTWNVPFSSEDNARISFQGQSVVTSPTPEWIVIYPTETPDLPIEAWVVKIDGNSVASALEGRRYTTFKSFGTTSNLLPGGFSLRYPADAPVLTPGNYAIGGRSVISTSGGIKSVPAIPFEFKVEDPASSSGSSTSGTPNTGGTPPPTVDALVVVFGSYATSIPQNFIDQLTPRIRSLIEISGWTFSSLRYNGRTVTPSELVSENILAAFGSNWNMYLVQ